MQDPPTRNKLLLQVEQEEFPDEVQVKHAAEHGKQVEIFVFR